MTFGRYLVNQKVSEWGQAYLEYTALKNLLSPAKIFQKKFAPAFVKGGMVKYRKASRNNKTYEQVIECIRAFESLFKSELVKIDLFFQYKLLDLTERAKLLDFNAKHIRSKLEDSPPPPNQQEPQEVYTHSSHLKDEATLKQYYKIFYKESSLLKAYVHLNQTALVKIMKKYAKVVATLPKQQQDNKEIWHFDLFNRFTSSQPMTYMNRNESKLISLMDRTQEDYIALFYPAQNMQKNGRQDFRNYTTVKPLSPNQVLFYGIFFGISCMLFLFIVLKFIEAYTSEDSDDQRKSLSLIFPLFRGNGLFIAYFWLLAWNVKVWQNNHINYKLIFKFKSHFSQMYEILYRAAFFTFVYFICFVWYLILKTPQDMRNSHGVDLYVVIDWIDPDYLPLIGWVILLGYVFFPFTRIPVFNSKGRKYFFKLLWDCLRSPFVKMEFRISWMTDMLVSFAGPLKDFETTICFYLSKIFDNQTSCNSDGRISQIIINVFPVVYRILQCCRQGYDRKAFFNTQPFYNTIKYVFSLATSLLSYKYSQSKESDDLIAWVVIGSLSTLISFYWDLAEDWGLLVIGKTWKDTHLIGRKLYYGNRNFYLIAIVSNFILRIVWALNISLGLTDLIDSALGVSGMFKFFVYFLELFRRCYWNFFRVELEHLNNCNNYKAVMGIDLPVNFQMHYSPNNSNFAPLSASSKTREDLKNIEINTNSNRPINSPSPFAVAVADPSPQLDTIEEGKLLRQISQNYIKQHAHCIQIQLSEKYQKKNEDDKIQKKQHQYPNLDQEEEEDDDEEEEEEVQIKFPFAAQTEPANLATEEPVEINTKARKPLLANNSNNHQIQVQFQSESNLNDFGSTVGSKEQPIQSISQQQQQQPQQETKPNRTQETLALFEAQLLKGIASKQYTDALQIIEEMRPFLRTYESHHHTTMLPENLAFSDQEQDDLLKDYNSN